MTRCDALAASCEGWMSPLNVSEPRRPIGWRGSFLWPPTCGTRRGWLPLNPSSRLASRRQTWSLNQRPVCAPLAPVLPCPPTQPKPPRLRAGACGLSDLVRRSRAAALQRPFPGSARSAAQPGGIPLSDPLVWRSCPDSPLKPANRQRQTLESVPKGSPRGLEGSPTLGEERCKSSSRLRVMLGGEFILMTTHVNVRVVRMQCPENPASAVCNAGQNLRLTRTRLLRRQHD